VTVYVDCAVAGDAKATVATSTPEPTAARSRPTRDPWKYFDIE
jgi:hypothetical protein